MNRYVCIRTYMFILPEISAHRLQLKRMGGHVFFSVPPTNEASFATRRFFTSTTIFSHLESVGSHKNTRYVSIKTYLYILPKISGFFSSSLAIKMYGRPFFSGAILQSIPICNTQMCGISHITEGDTSLYKMCIV